MSWKSFAIGFALATAIGVAACVWLVFALGTANADIRMGDKTFFDMGDTNGENGYISFSGSIGGAEPIAFPNNIYTAKCLQNEGMCRTANLQQIGNQHISDISFDTLTIKQWTADKVVAESLPGMPACVRISLIIHRKSEIIEYVRSPVDTSDELCNSVEKRTIGWTIEDGPTAMNERRKMARN